MKYKEYVSYIFVIGLLVISPMLFAADKVGDFDRDGVVSINDVVYELAWIQSGRPTDTVLVVNRAKEIYASAVGPISRIPDEVTDDVSDSGVNIDDVVFMLAWIQSGKTSDSSVVETRAAEIMASVSSNYLSKSPEMEIGSSTVPVTITGIQTDP